MFEVRQKPEMVERALLVRFYFDAREAPESESLLEELGELVKTLGVEVVESVLCRSREKHKKFLCGTASIIHYDRNAPQLRNPKRRSCKEVPRPSRVRHHVK